MAEVTHVFKMTMTCEGCSGAAERVLKKRGEWEEPVGYIELAEENKNIQTNLETQEVIVTSTLTSDELLDILKKTKKEVSYIGTK